MANRADVTSPGGPAPPCPSALLAQGVPPLVNWWQLRPQMQTRPDVPKHSLGSRTMKNVMKSKGSRKGLQIPYSMPIISQIRKTATYRSKVTSSGPPAI